MDETNYDWSSPSRHIPDIVRPITLSDWDRHIAAGRKIDKTIVQTNFLYKAQEACMGCRMCPLGCNYAMKDSTLQDPHLFSNRCFTSKIMFVLPHPGWEDLKCGKLLTGIDNKYFNTWLTACGRSKDEFYITSLVKCYTTELTAEYIEKCEVWLRMEIDAINPALIVAYGSTVFNYLCPNVDFIDFGANQNKIIVGKYQVPVLALPRPESNVQEFRRGIKIICALRDRI